MTHDYKATWEYIKKLDRDTASFPPSIYDTIYDALKVAEQMRWRSIDSAPRDGRVILIEGEFYGGETSVVYPARWSPIKTRIGSQTIKYEWEVLTEGGQNNYSDGIVHHWMPLPQPPDEIDNGKDNLEKYLHANAAWYDYLPGETQHLVCEAFRSGFKSSLLNSTPPPEEKE